MHSDDDNGRLAALPFALARNALIKRRELTAAPCVSRVLAAFVDVSGYTRFADEIISRHKDRGLGQLVDELERLLVPAATAALRHDGNIVAIEGDALLVTFDEADDLVRFCRDLQPLRETVARTPDGAAHRLRLDIGVSHGRLYEFVAGDDDGRARPEVLLVASGRRPAPGHAQGRRQRHRQPSQGQDRQEQDGPALS